MFTNDITYGGTYGDYGGMEFQCGASRVTLSRMYADPLFQSLTERLRSWPGYLSAWVSADDLEYDLSDDETRSFLEAVTDAGPHLANTALPPDFQDAIFALTAIVNRAITTATVLRIETF